MNENQCTVRKYRVLQNRQSNVVSAVGVDY